MNNATIVERLNQADSLLGERRFDVAAALATSLDEILAGLDPYSGSNSRIPSRIRDRVQSVRWAAEVGRQLTYLAGTGTNKQLGSRWNHPGASARREGKIGLANIRVH